MSKRLGLCVLATLCLTGASGFTSQRATRSDMPGGYRERSLFNAPNLRGMHIELLEDERLTGPARASVESSNADGEQPCDSIARSVTDFCASVKRLALRPALVRLVDSNAQAVGLLTLERAVATLSVLHVSRTDSVLAVTVDLSANAGSYSGPLVRFVSAEAHSVGWTQLVDAAGHRTDLALPTTLKTAWHANASGDLPEILLVACRPNLEVPAGSDAAFVTTYSRLYLEHGAWRRTDRRVAELWENDGIFPDRAQFPN